jgi:hypothetical protein
MGTLVACVSNLTQAGPAVTLAPAAGRPGTVVTVSGTDFPPETRVSVRIGPPSVGATPQSYGEAIVGTDGRLSLSFTMPAYWPSGEPITETDLVVVVLNEDGSAKAISPFFYIPASSGALTPTAITMEAHGQAILAWRREGAATGFCGEIVVHESGYVEIISCQEAVPLARRLLSEDTIERLHTWAATYRSFEVERISGRGESRVLTRVTFVGNGSRQVSEAEVRTIQALLETLASSE